jgi:hypothetical protein
MPPPLREAGEGTEEIRCCAAGNAVSELLSAHCFAKGTCFWHVMFGHTGELHFGGKVVGPFVLAEVNIRENEGKL